MLGRTRHPPRRQALWRAFPEAKGEGEMVVEVVCLQVATNMAGGCPAPSHTLLSLAFSATKRVPSSDESTRLVGLLNCMLVPVPSIEAAWVSEDA